MLPTGYRFLHLSSNSKWQEAEKLVGQPLVTTRPDEAHALVFCGQCWALVRSPMATPYTVTLECCDDGDADQHQTLWAAVQQVATAALFYDTL